MDTKNSSKSIFPSLFLSITPNNSLRNLKIKSDKPKILLMLNLHLILLVHKKILKNQP